MQVDYDDLAGENKAGKARELIVHLEHRGQLDALIEAGQDLRPDVRWPDLHPPSPTPAERPARAKDVTGCVFISYERTDRAYARQLAGALRERDCTPWLDDRIDLGERWWRTIVRAVRACAAFAVVMTPEAERSDWVEREVLLAQREGKPILPLLLRGREFPLLINVQYVDVTDGGMPPRMFYARLDRTLGRSGAPKAIAPKPFVQEEERLPSVLTPRQPYEPEMILIPAGEFLMGSDPAKDRYAAKDEQPQHTLTLPDYYLARTPVTNAQYLAFVQATGQSAPGHWAGGLPPEGKGDHPVVYVSWHDALAYCRWLAQATGKPYALPSEPEWEKGARGADGSIYPWGNQWDAARCNAEKGLLGDTTPVGAYPEGASPYGPLLSAL